jgi:hypothetical protein
VSGRARTWREFARGDGCMHGLHQMMPFDFPHRSLFLRTGSEAKGRAEPQGFWPKSSRAFAACMMQKSRCGNGLFLSIGCLRGRENTTENGG